MRGFRIELGEIESHLLAHSAVRDAVVLTLGEGAERSLVAYVAGGERESLRSHLAGRLPNYMVPSSFVVLDTLPLTPNGKVNRKALAGLASGRELAGDTSAAPRTAAEELIAGIWAAVLKTARVGIHDNFFDLGGHSLLATQLVSRVRETFRTELPLRALFEAPTVAGLAARVESGRKAPLPPILQIPRDRDLPASFAQERLWLLDQLGGEGASYNLPSPLRLRGPLSAPTLAGALEALAERHESLRTTFALAPDGTVFQRVAPAVGLPLPLVDLATLLDPEAEVRHLAAEDVRRLFDLQAGPLLRATLLRLGDDDHALLLTMHHIISDGWSVGVLIRELMTLYHGGTLPELPVQYADFAAWQRGWLAGETLDAEIAWWRERLAGVPAVLELPSDRPRPTVRTPRGGTAAVLLPADLAAGLVALARRANATLFMTLLAGFQTLLRRYTGRDDVPVGTPIANRNQTKIEGIVGFFVNTLVLRGDLSGDPTFLQVLRRTRETALEAYDHQDLPFEKLVEALQPERSLAYTPLFQVLLLVQTEAPVPKPAALAVGPLRLAGFALDTAKLDLTLAIASRPAGLAVQAEYSRDLFDAPTVLRLLEHLRVLLEGITADPELRLSDLPLLTAPERQALIFEENDTAAVHPDRPVHELFEEQARRSPHRVAVTCEGRSLTYAELNARANRIAHHLLRLGAGPEERIGVSLERSLDLVAGLLGILKAGAAYLPLDPSLPAERLAFLMADGGITRVLDAEEVRAALASGSPLGSDTDPESGGGPRSLAYVLYTSGSTGRPKGVEVEHRSIVRLVREGGFAEMDETEIFLQLAPIPFDASTLEIWGPLLNGGRLAVFPPRAPSLEELAEALRSEGISTLWLTAGLFHQMAEAQPESLRRVRQLLAGGDALSVPHVRRILEGIQPGHRLINGYGPTENTTFTCCWSMDAASPLASSVPIGRPISNTRVYLLGRDLEPVPLGVAGELYAAGEGLARGYLGRPDLTAERFVPSPLPVFPGERLYRTGDLARRLPSGEIEFLGRLDNQVKLRGFRIELGEIEAALCGHPAVRQAAVLAREDRPGDRRLVAYIEVEGQTPSTPELRAFLARKLPDYMVPAAVVTLETLPLTSNGKVDRRALSAVELGLLESLSTVGDAPRDEIEELLAGIWCHVLGVEAVGVHDDFFELGGHSLLATRVVSRVREVFGIELPLRALFEAPTLAGLAARIDAARREGIGVQAPPMRPVARDGELRASFAQERLWFLDRFGADRSSYNVPSAIRLSGRLDVPALAASLTGIVERHESLRTTFSGNGRGGAPRPAGDRARLRAAAAGGRPGRAAGICPRGGDRTAGPRGGAAGCSTLDADRSSGRRSCGWRSGSTSSSSPCTTSSRTGGPSACSCASCPSCTRPRSRAVHPSCPGCRSSTPTSPRGSGAGCSGEVLAAQLGWWRERLAGAPAVIELPADRPRPPVQSSRGGRLSYGLPARLTRDLKALVRSAGATLFMALLAGFQAVLGRATGSEDLPVGTPIANRNRAETEGLIGFFVNTLVLRGDLSADPGFAGLLARSREATLGAYAHQDVPFEKLVEELRPERDPSRSPLFQIMVILQNAPMEALELPDLTATPLVPDGGTTKFDLRLSLAETPEGLTGSLVYNLDLFDGSTVVRLGARLERLLAAAVESPGLPLSALPLLAEAEHHQLLCEWNDTRADWDLERPLHVWIGEQARRTPDAAALTFEGETLTYRELDDRAGRLAARLRRLGAGPEIRVGIAAERSLELVVGLLGILKAGACYVPLDPSYPAERLAFMLEDSQEGIEEPILLTQERLASALPPHRGRVLLLDEIMDAAPVAAPVVLPEHPAYVIYTSGSTGRPKGAVNSHRAIVNRLVWMQEEYGLTPGDVVLQKTPFSFDVSVWELFWPLMVGARLVVARPGGHQDTAYLAGLIRREGVTTLHFVPSMLQVFLEQPGVETCASLRRVICSGEALPFELQQRFFAKMGSFAGLHNLYGPTEAAVDVAVWACESNGARPIVPIGRPISNLGIHILDRSLHPAPMGVPGELHIAGVGLARGYLNRPAMTAERFIPDPFGPPGARLYRTGDLSRYLPDGRIEYLGRLDHQVKIRGFRIELGEIEATLCCPPVRQGGRRPRPRRPAGRQAAGGLPDAVVFQGG